MGIEIIERIDRINDILRAEITHAQVFKRNTLIKNKTEGLNINKITKSG